nr:Stk1 family PASTA domain-containing Ser/Thr kinase [Metallococcus carri]
MTETPRLLGGRYEVGELIGRGGMAEVHLGHDTRLGRTVAIKMLRADLARDHTFLARFRREAQSAAGLNHHAIVAVYDSGEDVHTETGGATIDVPYIVMEYVDGETLRDILNDEGTLSPDEAARITMGILSALEYSHDKGIVHRDIKPANVMLTRGGGVKVMDFGIARALADVGATMTSAQAVVGTARYLSPEQAKGDPVDARSDLYSAGCVFYELLCGRTPFVGEPVSLVYQHLNDEPAPPSAYAAGVPEPMDAVTLHSLEKKREHRYQTAADFRADLQAARTGRPLSAGALASLAAAGDQTDREPVATPPPPARRDSTRDMTDADHPRGRTGLWVAALIAALAAILGIGYLVMNNSAGPKMATVPGVVDQPQGLAENQLRQANFVPSSRTANSDKPVGTVVSQDPRGGTDAAVGSTVTLVVSAGPNQKVVPDVRGKSEADARQMLKDAGFTQVATSPTPVDNTQYPANQVASTNPASGVAASPTAQITLSISSGQVTVPGNLVGMDVSQAQNEVTKAHLTPKIEYRRTADSSEFNKVIATRPEGETKVSVNSTVTLIVGMPAETTQTITQTRTVTRTQSTSSSSSTSSSAPPSSTSTPTSTSTSAPPPSTSTPPPPTASPPTPSLP